MRRGATLACRPSTGSCPACGRLFLCAFYALKTDSEHLPGRPRRHAQARGKAGPLHRGAIRKVRRRRLQSVARVFRKTPCVLVETKRHSAMFVKRSAPGVLQTSRGIPERSHLAIISADQHSLHLSHFSHINDMKTGKFDGLPTRNGLSPISFRDC